MRMISSFAIASVVWVAALHWIHHVEPEPLVARLANRQLRQLDEAALRGTNPEWEFMNRAFLTWSLANLALKERAWEPRALPAIDALIARTLRDEQAHGADFFLMRYGAGLKQSLFIDSELALSLGLRRLVREDEATKALFQARVHLLEAHFARAPFPASYPDEAWTFDASVALAALKLSDALDHTDHSALSAGWVSAARAQLLDARTGLLNSSYHLDGSVRDGPEGSSIWLACSMLAVVDPAFAREQYELARGALVHSVAGFELAREWPSGGGVQDIDSGLQLPLVEASPSSSGLALVASATFGDSRTLGALLTTLDFAGFPRGDAHELRYAAGNQLGDAVVLYALTVGPAWKAARGTP
jgi:hypothetical protein